jgi:hypothetical protein
MKKTVFFTMVSLQDGKWTRVGNAYNSRKQASGWLSFVKSFWGGRSVKVSQCTLRFEDGKLCENSRKLLDSKYNMDA